MIRAFDVPLKSVMLMESLVKLVVQNYYFTVRFGGFASLNTLDTVFNKKLSKSLGRRTLHWAPSDQPRLRRVVDLLIR